MSVALRAASEPLEELPGPAVTSTALPPPLTRFPSSAAYGSWAAGVLGPGLRLPLLDRPSLLSSLAATGVLGRLANRLHSDSSSDGRARGSENNSGNSGNSGRSGSGRSGSSGSSGSGSSDSSGSSRRDNIHDGASHWSGSKDQARESHRSRPELPHHGGSDRTLGGGEDSSPQPLQAGRAWGGAAGAGSWQQGGRGPSSSGQSAYPAPASGRGADNPSKARDVASLSRIVEEGAREWAAARNFKYLYTTFHKAGEFAERLGMAKRGGAGTSKNPLQAALLHRTFETLVEVYLPLLPGLRRPIELVIPVYACAKAGYWEGGRNVLAAALVRRLAQDGGAMMQQASGQSHGQLWWALSVVPPEVLAAAPTRELLRVSEARMLQMKAADFDPQASANVLLACARLSDFHSSSEVLHHLTACLLHRVAEGADQDLGNAWWALGKLREEGGHTPHPTHLQQLAAAVTVRLAAEQHGFIAQHLSDMLWSCAKLGYTDGALLRPLAAAAAHARGRMNVQSLVHTLWALAELQVDGESEAVAAVAEQCRRHHFDRFNPQEISTTVLALAKLRYNHQLWFKNAIAAVVRSGGIRPQYWSNLLYALALVRHQASPALMEGAVAIVTRAQLQDCANTLWALAVLRLYDNQVLVDAVSGRLGELLQKVRKQLTAQGLCNSLWALAVMGPEVLVRHNGLVAQLLREVVRRWEAAGEVSSSATLFNEEQLSQLWQAQQELTSLGGADGARLASILDASPALLGAMRQAVAAKQAETTTSGLQRVVAAAVRRLQQQQQPQSSAAGSPAILSVEQEVVVEGLCGRVNFVVELEGGRRVAVEVDGPSHCLANQRKVDGYTALRHRQLRRLLGEANVLSVPCWELDELDSAAARAEYMRRVLDLGVGVAPGAMPAACEPPSLEQGKA